jgi:3-hydroxyacyl-[acyl-carrier-protein] dehydratase
MFAPRFPVASIAMPPQFLFDISGIDLTKVVYDQQAIRAANPQRGHMEHLNAVVWTDPAAGRIVGYKDVRLDEFWVDGHIPGRPLLPGVIMIECGAQLASFYTRTFCGWTGFIGFSAADGVKFRQQVSPGCRLYLLGEKQWERHRRILSHVQGVADGRLVFEAQITGVRL